MAKNAGDSEVWLPFEFPYEFGVSSPVSTETESSDDEEDFLAGLTQRLSNTTLLHDTTTQKQSQLTKTRDLAGSPQSTLSGMGGWCGGSGDGSPNDHSPAPSNPWEVIYAAAGKVARLKMKAQLSQLHFQNNHYQVEKQECDSVWGSQAIPKANWLAQQQVLQIQNRARELSYENEKCNRIMQLQHQNQRVQVVGSGSRVVLPGGSSVKRGSAGTGVFLPRHYETAPSDSRHRNDSAPVMLPAKPVYALNATSQPRFSTADYEALLARRNALLMQQERLIARREEASNCEIRLPQEWTY